MSLVEQSYKNLEIILVDDGSKDDGPMICDRLAEKYTSIRVFHKENGGVQSARHYGLEKATGDYITFVDSDDWVEKQTYELCINQFEHDDYDMVCFGFKTEYNGVAYATEEILTPIFDEKTIKTFSGTNDIMAQFMTQNDSFEGFLWNKVWKKEYVKDRKFREDIQITEDSIFVWHALLKTDRVCYINLQLYHYRFILSSMSKKSSVERFMSATITWDYLLKQPMAKNEQMVKRLKKSKVVWNLKVADQLTSKEKIDVERYLPNIISKVKEEQDIINELNIPYRILANILLHSWGMYKVASKTMYNLKAFYVKIHSRKSIEI